MTTGGPRSEADACRSESPPTFAELSSQPRVTLRVLEATQDESTSFPLNSMCFGWCSLMSENPISCKRVRFETAKWMDAANSVQYKFRLREQKACVVCQSATAACWQCGGVLKLRRWSAVEGWTKCVRACACARACVRACARVAGGIRSMSACLHVRLCLCAPAVPLLRERKG